jgi:hypothetical protein
MPTFEIIRTTTRQERFTVLAGDPAEAMKRFEKGDRNNRGKDTISTELAAFERQPVAAAGARNADR